MATRRIKASHVQALIDKMTRVSGLLVMYRMHRGSGKGRPFKQVSILNQSAIVLIIACWEAYIEDLSKAAFDFLLRESDLASALPTNVLVMASKHIRVDPDETQVWQLADKGWKKVLQSHADSIVGKYIDFGFHTPNTEKVDELLFKLIGLNQLSQHWKWKGVSATKSPAVRLDKLVIDRHEIAHRLANKPISQKYVLDSADLVQRLAAVSSNIVRSHLYKLVRKNPWGHVTYKGTG